MDISDNTFSDIIDLFKSWIPWRSEPATVSRDFWMPDQSCRVCYECDSQFTVINRRHHCRLCGRIFCAKCTANSVPVPSSDPRTAREEQEKIRVCNYCFKQWQQGITSFDNGIQVPSLDLSSSPSEASVASSKSSGTTNSSDFTLSSLPYSAGPYHLAQHNSGPSSLQAPEMERNSDKQEQMALGRSNDLVADEEYYSPTSFVFPINRCDDDDGEENVYVSYNETRDFSRFNDYYQQVEFDNMRNADGAHKSHLDGETFDLKSLSSSPLNHSYGSQSLEGLTRPREKNDLEADDECEPASSMYTGEENVTDAVDFENNGLIWLPPEPEDEEDEKEAGFFDEDDDDGDAAGGWGCLRASSSFGSGDFRSRDRSSEEHKQVMKNVVDGHFRALVAQLLQVESISLGDDEDNWLEIITSLSWEAATLLKPDMSKGGGMDPGGYVKVKCIASGSPSQSMVVRGVVCKKNVAHRRMTSKIEKPRLLILGGALEYQRVSNHLSSVATLLQQEMDHLKMAVAKIDAHQPDVLLVENSVSRFAQEYLHAKDISIVLNVKRPLLDRIARCTGAQVVPSIDHLSSPKLGYCELFHVERFLEDLGSAGLNGKKLTKTLMYFEGCPKPLGFTILLRGANGDVLKKVKHVVQYGVFAAYHLALETSFLADEGATLPELPLNSPITVALPDKPSSVDRSISTVPGMTVPAHEKQKKLQTGSEPQGSNSVPNANLVSAVSTGSVEKVEEVLADGALPDSMEPHSSHINSSEFLSAILSASKVAPDSHQTFEDKNGMCSEDRSLPKAFVVNNGLASADNNLNVNGYRSSDGILSNNSPNDAKKMVANLLAPLEASSAQQDFKSNLAELGTLKQEILPSPSDHQSILVSLSSRCVWKGTVCERSHLFRIKYYGSFDKPLGRFLQDHLFDQSYSCQSCDKPSEAHVHCYTHRQGTLTISVKKLSEILLPGEKDGKIWMWHRCLRCPRVNGFPPATRRIVMSDAAWGLSFGKFLELSFSNHAAASRVASCGHSLHRDCLRFYGFGKMVACFRYAAIDVLSVYLPPSKLDFNFENQEWIREETEEVIKRAELLFSEVLNALSQMAEKKSSTGATNACTELSEFKKQIACLEVMFKQEKAEFEESVQKTLKREGKDGLPAFDILQINRLRRQLLFQSYIWDHHLVCTASLDDSSISRLNSAHDETASINTNHLMEMNLAYNSVKGFGSCDSLPVDMKLLKDPDQQGFGGKENQPDSFDHEMDVTEGVNLGKEGPDKMSDANLICDQPDKQDSSGNICKTPSEGQFPIMKSLSGTFDAAWTGENHPGSGNYDCGPLSYSGTVDSSNTLAGPEGLDMEDRLVDENEPKVWHSLAPTFSTRGSDSIEDSVSWLTMPFLNFYRSLNKNFLASSEKFDTLGEYNPVYLSSFGESELQNEAGRFLPEGVNNIIIPIYDDEPTSIISYALTTRDYIDQLKDDGERINSSDLTSSFSLSDVASSMSFHSLDEVFSSSYRSIGSTDESTFSKSGHRSSLSLDPLSYTKAMHPRVSFESKVGKVKYSVTCYYAKRFEALREICCPSELDYIRSLSRCKKWGAQGGKSNVFFAKTLDERFIIKQVTKTELESFIKFAPSYFKYLSESIGLRSPTALAKILGIYQVSSKNLKGGKEWKMDVLVMENLLFGRNVTRLYDLKGSSRSRYNPDSSGSNKVLLDQNLIEAMSTSPIFVGNKAKRLLERAVWNDTSFLASIDVMDYSLLVGVDEEKHELVIGIIDFMRQYTWDKHLETWVKASGILGGPKNASPTVISPKQYKKRFRKAMSTYFLMVPDQWSPLPIVPSGSQSDLAEETAQVSTSVE